MKVKIMMAVIRTTLFLFFVGWCGIPLQGLYAQALLLDVPPRNYVCYRLAEPLEIDGRLDEDAWQRVPWTEDFVDIEGDRMPLPLHRTRAKMVWDDEYLYIGFELEEPHIWATYTERESVIFHENNIEVFIDPSGDSHHYVEFQVNALGTEWDLMLTKPYRYGGLPISAWDISGLKTGIHLSGTINDPSDVDTLWSVELALPWRILSEVAPWKRRPAPGEQWRINFSRVQWRLDIVDGAYQKTVNPDTGRPYPEYNWVWSPQLAINMHIPEYWGYVQFSGLPAGEGEEPFVPHPDLEIKYLLRELFYEQYRYRYENGHFAATLEELSHEKMELYQKYAFIFDVSRTRFRLSCPSMDGNSTWHITEDSRIWKEGHF